MSTITSTPDGIAGEVSHERVHFFWLVDISGSMEGSKIQTVNYSIKQVLGDIQDIEEGECVKILMRTITFGDKAEWRDGEEPVEASDFIWKDIKDIKRNTLTCTTRALELLLSALDVNKIGMRSCPPVCILLSDGFCTDSEERYNEAIRKLDSHPWGAKAVRLAIGIGDRQNYNKQQLDQFISPYLRNEGKVETLPADGPRKLVEFILTAATTAIVKSSSPKSNVDKDTLVNITMKQFYDSPAIDPEKPPDPYETF